MNKRTIIIIVIIALVIIVFLKSDSKMKYPVPVKRISSKFGNRIHPISGVKKYHNGVDIPVPIGTPVISPASGTVKSVYYNATGGNQLVISHGVYQTGYAHLDSTAVKVGDKVKEGQQVAKSGNTGGSTGPHLHLTLRKNGELVDPELHFTV